MNQSVQLGTVMAMASSESKSWCIYCHTAPNGKRYIGQTNQDPEVRWNGGFGYSSNKHFSSAIKKYGWKNIKHVILCWTSCKEYADHLEKWFIAKYNTTNRKYGYNITAGGGGSCGRCLDDSSRKKMSIALRKSEKIKAKQTPVLQYDIDNKLIKRHDSISTAARQMGVSKAAIRSACRGASNTACGFIWKYEDEELQKKAEQVIKQRTATQTIGLPVIQYQLDGAEIARFNSTCDASSRTGLNRLGISECCRGKRKTSQGYIWKYAYSPIKGLSY